MSAYKVTPSLIGTATLLSIFKEMASGMIPPKLDIGWLNLLGLELGHNESCEHLHLTIEIVRF